jgi:NitT/TauT family transport system substrate-binding protein
MTEKRIEVGAIGRRDLMKSGAAFTAGMLLGGRAIGFEQAVAGEPTTVNMQLGWIENGDQLGEIAAKRLGYFEEEGLALKIQPGGPNTDGVAIVASDHAQVGQISSSPSLMLAASQDIPVKCFAIGKQQHPFAFFSLKKNPVRVPADFRGKRVGIQATGVILLRALLLKNGMSLNDVKVVDIGYSMTPLLTGQVDVVTGWITSVSAIKVLGPDHVTLRLWDAGVKLYASPYYATSKTVQSNKDLLLRFTRATARGYAYAYKNPEKAVELLVKEMPSLVAADELMGAKIALSLAFDEATKKNGWGTMDPAVWQEQIDLYSKLGQFTKRTPKLDEVITLDILNETKNSRPHFG